MKDSSDETVPTETTPSTGPAAQLPGSPTLTPHTNSTGQVAAPSSTVVVVPEAFGGLAADVSAMDGAQHFKHGIKDWLVLILRERDRWDARERRLADLLKAEQLDNARLGVSLRAARKTSRVGGLLMVVGGAALGAAISSALAWPRAMTGCVATLGLVMICVGLYLSYEDGDAQ